MAGRAALVLVLAVLSVTLAGCGPCGFFWDDWRSGKAAAASPRRPNSVDFPPLFC